MHENSTFCSRLEPLFMDCPHCTVQTWRHVSLVRRYHHQMDTQLTNKLPCVGAEELKQALLSRGDPPIAALYDLLEIADNCGATSMHVFMDERLFKTQSLLHPGLAPFQGVNTLTKCCMLYVLNLCNKLLCWWKSSCAVSRYTSLLSTPIQMLCLHSTPPLLSGNAAT